MTAADGLERRYRRLLGWYPAAHRQAHGEEMLGVLLAAARPGQRRPGLAATADLISGALRIRLRALLRGTPDQRWEDALAVVSVLAPLLMLAAGLVTSNLVAVAVRAARGYYDGLSWLTDPRVWLLLAGPVTVAALALLGLRRATALAALTVTAGETFVLAFASMTATYWSSPVIALWVFLGLLAAAAPVLSAGPRRGRQILRWWGVTAASLLAIVFAQLTWGPDIQFPLDHATLVGAHMGARVLTPQVRLAGILAAAMAAAALCLVTATGRRVLVLLAIPALPYVVIVAQLTGLTRLWLLGGAAAAALVYLPPLVLTGLAVSALSRTRPGGTA
jgi:hypothetical protein